MHKCFEGTKVWATILLEQFQNRSGLETANAKTCPFPLQIESSIQTFTYMHLGHALTFISVKKLFFTIVSMIFIRKVMH